MPPVNLGLRSAVLLGSESTFVDLSGFVGEYSVTANATIEPLGGLQRTVTVASPTLQRDFALEITAVRYDSSGEMSALEAALGESRRFVLVKPDVAANDPFAAGAISRVDTAELHITSANVYAPSNHLVALRGPGFASNSVWRFGRMLWFTAPSSTPLPDVLIHERLMLMLVTQRITLAGGPNDSLKIAPVGQSNNEIELSRTVGFQVIDVADFPTTVSGTVALDLHFAGVNAFEGGLIAAYRK